jgi:crotonobetainyl-CoA:carnitine CoA-transferase CaiB-like acyl-CoA transferase
MIKVEPPQGDETREWGPPFSDEARTMSAYFTGVNRNKHGLVLDLGVAAGREVLMRLLADADVLVENFKTGTLERWGIGNDVLAARFPRLVHCRISGFGADGPLGGLPGYDAVAQAMTGLISVNGSVESGPVRIGVPIVDMGTGLNATIAILAALYERARSGRGQFVEATLYDTGIAFQHPHAPNWFLSGRAPVLTGNAHPNISPYDLFPTATRPIFLGVGNDGQFQKLCALIERPAIAADPRFATNPLRAANRTALTELLVEALADVDGDALCERLLAAGVPAGPAQDIGQALQHPHTAHRGMVVEGEGGYRATGAPAKLARTPATVRKLPPRFGAESRDVLAAAGFSADEIDRLVAEGVVRTRHPRETSDETAT